MSKVDECQKLLREIAELKKQLEQLTVRHDKKKIETEIRSKQSRYNILQCGAVDPKLDPPKI